MYQNVTEGKFVFFDKEVLKSAQFYFLEPGVYPSITDNVEAMNTLIQERHNHHSENCIPVKMSRRTQKVENNLAKENLVLHSLVRTWNTFWEVLLSIFLA